MEVELSRWVVPQWMEPYRHMVVNLCGYDLEEVMNGASTVFMQGTPVQRVIAVSVNDQVALLYRLHDAGALPGAPAVQPLSAEDAKVEDAKVEDAKVEDAKDAEIRWCKYKLDLLVESHDNLYDDLERIKDKLAVAEARIEALSHPEMSKRIGQVIERGRELGVASGWITDKVIEIITQGGRSGC